MATPLSSDLPLSSELQSIFAQASTLAKQEGRPVVSAHLLLALYSVNNHAALFLEEHLLPTLPAQVQRRMRDATEHPSCVERICERSKRLARGSNCDDVTSMHLLAAMLRESNSSAYRMLEAGGINVSGIRTRVMSYATDSSPQHQLSPSRPDTDHPGLHSSNSSPIEIHPSLRQNLTTSNRPQQARSARLRKRERERNRSRLEERSSPVHPALHDTWLRTTPAGGIPTVDREDVQRAHPTPMAQAPQGHTQPAQASAATTPPVTHHTQQDRETPVVPRKTLKERFAELKKQARKRRSDQQNWPRPSTLSPDKIPPAVRRASKASRCRGQRPDEACDDEPLILPPTKRRAGNAQEEERERAEERRREAVEDARQATQDLASRLFGKISKSDEDAQHEDDASCDTHPTEADEPVTQEVADEAPQHTQVPPGADDVVAEVEVASSSTMPPSAKKQKQTARRPDTALAKEYRLDPEEFPLLTKLGRNLTEEAAMVRIDPVVGRDTEITQLIDILGKRRGNNPLLVGDPGVGKTAIVEGLAHKFVDFARRDIRAGKRSIIELELGRMLSGTHLRGSLSERLIAIKDEVRRADGKVIVFLDEIHAWLNASGSGDGGDAAGELKTALARGHFPCIGATTNDEFTEFVEQDPAFERRFQIVNVEEPDVPTAVVIARGIREHYEAHHGITYADRAIDAAVRLAHRYIHDRRLPDKAINVLDLAGSRAARCGDAYVRRTDVAHIVAEMANLPPDRLTQSDRARFLKIEEYMSRCVIGHDNVIRAVSEVLRRNYAGFRSKRPIGSLLFLGPTGVGKTEMVKALADFLFHDRDAIVRLDMSEFMEAHAVSRFIGAPPGYVGYEQGGQLTEAVRKRPYQVVLLDEIEKAHPDILNLLLQLFDEGRLTDGRGRVVDFSNTLVVMTSNLGAEAFERVYEDEEPRGRIGFGPASLDAPASSASPSSFQGLEEQVCGLAREHFTPELWGRLDEKLVFMPLCRDEIAQIAVLQLEDSARRLEEECGISLDFTDEVIGHLIRHGGYNRRSGARPMRHTIQRLVEGKLARLILGGDIVRGELVTIDVDPHEDQLFFTSEDLVTPE